MWLWALLLVPALAAFYWRAQASRDALIGRIVAPRLRQQLASGVNLTMRWVRAGLVLLAIGLAVLAMAKPRMGYVQREIKTKGRDVLLAIDTSRSMLATDVTPTRLARAKLVSQDLMRLLRGDRIGVIAFAGSAFLQAPLTLDYNAVLTTLDELDTDVIPRGGSNLAAAIQTAIDAFGKAEGVMRALVVLTDGEELDADGVAAAKRAGEAGIRVFTIGLGSSEGALIPIRTRDGRQDFVRDAAGEPVTSKLDAARLQEIAEVTGGFYTKLTPDVAREVFQNGIEPLEEQETGVMSSRQPVEQYEWPLGAALVCLTLWILLGEGRWVRRRVASPLTRAAAFAGMLLVVQGRSVVADGLESYQAGDYQGALEAFEGEAERLPETEKLKFNAGAAAYQVGDFAKAVELFTSALLAEDENLRGSAEYNLGNSLARRGEAAKSLEGKKADWTDAIDHYTAALDLDPANTSAEENREIVKKMLEDLNKQQEQEKDEQKEKKDKQEQKNDEQEQKKDEQKESEKDQEEEPDDGEKKDEGKPEDQEGGEGEPEEKDGEKGDEQNDQSGDEESDEQKQDESGGDEAKPDQQKDAENGDQDQPGAEPTPTPGDPKEGDLKSQGNEDSNEDDGQMGEAQPAEEALDGEMSEAQARSLLRFLQGDEERVEMMERQNMQNVRRDW